MTPIDPAEVTPEPIYRNRRAFMRGAAALGVSAAALAAAACGLDTFGSTGGVPGPGLVNDDLTDTPNTFEVITHYNNFYEFSDDKEAVAGMVKDFKTRPWTVQVGGLVKQAKTYDIDELIDHFPQQERVYRLRCVEGWSMVIPWQGFSLSKLLAEVEPLPQAKYLRFESVKRPSELPGQKNPFYQWPYVEGLRLDEAMHDLTLLATGLYAKPLPTQDGAPIRLVVPWKYGFKSIKSIVKIDLVERAPTTLWMAAAPNEYGFYANVNPDVPHPRWSQASERRIGEVRRRRTLPFNGYADDVVSLYKGMDLHANF